MPIGAKTGKIRDVLILAGLIPTKTTAKWINTAWSNAWISQSEEIAEQTSLYLKYRYAVRTVYDDKSSVEEDIVKIQKQLRRYRRKDK